MRIGQAFPSKYLKAADLQGQRIQVTIDGVEEMTIGRDIKFMVNFIGKKKGLVLNKTNANIITEIAGTDETNNWQGVKIVLYSTKGEFQGRSIDVLRVDYPPGAVRPPVSLDSDEIPF